MVYKLGTMADLETLPLMDAEIRNTIAVCLFVLDETYGSDRDIDKDLGGYLLFAEPGTSADELRSYFDYTQFLPEYVDLLDSDPQYACALYLLSNDFGIVILTALSDASKEIQNELQNQGGNIQ